MTSKAKSINEFAKTLALGVIQTDYRKRTTHHEKIIV